jgi:hypothetical protein
MPVRPGKPIDEITPEEIRQWKEWLLDRGINPVPIRQDIPAGTSSYAFDRDLQATIEYVGGERYFVGIVDGKIARLGPVESERESGNPVRPAASTQTASPENESLVSAELRKRKLA